MQAYLLGGIAWALCFVPAAVSGEDPFSVGTVWSGVRKVNPKMEQNWRLQITKRKGDSFEGEMTVEYKGANTYTVRGTATAETQGPVSFDSVRSGSFKQSFEGQLRDEEIRLTFQGKSMVDTDVEGTATLRRKPIVGERRRPSAEPPGRNKLTLPEQLAQREKARAAAKARAEALEARIEAEARKLGKKQLKDAIAENPQKTTEDRLRHSIYRERLAVLREEQTTPEERKARQEFALQLLGAMLREDSTMSFDERNRQAREENAALNERIRENDRRWLEEQRRKP